MKKTLLLAPANSVHRMFNRVNIQVLLDQGYQVHLAANFPGEGSMDKVITAYLADCAKRGIQVHSLPFARHSLTRNFRLVGEIQKLLRAEQFDLIHAHTETGGLLLRLSGRAARGSDLIYTPHGMSFYQGSSLKSQLLYRPIEHWICSGMDANIGINQEEYDLLRQWNAATARYTHGIGLNISDIEKVARTRNEVRAEFHIPEDAVLLLSVGELNENKNHRMVLDALHRLNRKDLYYIVCGAGEKQAALNSELKEKGLDDRVVLAGFRRDIPDILGAADIFVFPSFHEGLPVSLMEAMASGTAVLCSDIRGSRDLVKDGTNGFLFAPDDLETLVQKLRTLSDDSALRQSFAAYGKKRVAEFSYDTVYRELEGIYADARR